MGDWLFGWVYDLLYILQKSICYLLDFIREVFCKLVGIETVTIDGQNQDLLSHFLLSPAVRNTFLGVFLVAVILLFIFVIIAILKSEAADPQHKKTKGQIMVKALQTFVIFLLVPFILIAGVLLANVIIGAIYASMSGAMTDGNAYSSIGGQILVTSGYDAYIGPSVMRAEIERKFITGELNFNSLSVVKQYYNLGDINFFVGIAGGLAILIMFVMSAVMFVQRIFDIILLFIVSPVSVSTIPLDDGGRFRIWREMMVSKVLSAYGIILSMNIFFLIIPQVSQIAFFDSSFKNGIIQLLFILGGAFSITKANMIIAQLTGTNAGMQEMQQTMANVHSGMNMIRTAGHVAAGTAGMVIGGTDFLSNRKQGVSFFDNLSASVHSSRNQKEIEDDDGKQSDGDNGDVSGTATENADGIKDQTQEGTDGQSDASPNSGNTDAVSDASADSGLKNDSEQDNDSLAGAVKEDLGKDEKNDDNRKDKESETGNEVEDGADEQKKGSKFGAFVKGTTRLASLPAGIMKDLIQGGVITAGKNFIPRMKNVFTGSSVVSHADVHKLTKKAAKSVDDAAKADEDKTEKEEEKN